MQRTPAAAPPYKHVDRGRFAFRLDKNAAHPREIQRGRLGDFAGRGDGVSIISAASGQDGRLDNGFVPLVSSGFMPASSAPEYRPVRGRRSSRFRSRSSRVRGRWRGGTRIDSMTWKGSGIWEDRPPRKGRSPLHSSEFITTEPRSGLPFGDISVLPEDRPTESWCYPTRCYYSSRLTGLQPLFTKIV
jgi:hypothetical protein